MPNAPAAESISRLNEWLKTAGSLPEKEDDGKPATEGARSAEYSSDVKKTVPANSVEGATKNPEHGKTDSPVPDSGLAQTSTGKMPEVEKAVKVVEEESEKMASLDVTTDEGFAAAVASLNKAASYLPTLFAASGVATTQVAEKKEKATPASKEAADRDLAIATKISQYEKWGYDRGEITASYLRGYMDYMNLLHKAAADGSLAAMAGAEGGGEGMPPEAGAEAGGPPMPPEAAAGPPPGADAGAPPDAGGAPGGDPGAGGGAPSADDLAAAFAEMGLTPDVIMEAAQKLQGQVGGDQGAPPEQKEAALKSLAYITKLAGEAKTIMRSGKFQLKPAADKAELGRRSTAKSYLDEMLRNAR